MLKVLRDYYTAKNYPWWSNPYDLNIFGLRVEGNADLWNDTIGIAYFDGSDYRIERWVGTTTPGVRYLEQPMNSAGSFILAPGYHRSAWTTGKHNGDYPALVQVGEFKYWRDNDRDAVPEALGNLLTGTGNGVNLHHGGDSSKVGAYSAGCQVVRYKKALERIMALAEKQKESGHGSKYSYCLIDVKDDYQFKPFCLTDEKEATAVYSK